MNRIDYENEELIMTEETVILTPTILVTKMESYLGLHFLPLVS